MTGTASDIWAIDAVVALWTEEANRYRPPKLRSFFVDKLGVTVETYGGISLSEMLRRMDAARIEKAFLIAARSGSATDRFSFHIPCKVVADAIRQHPDRFYGLVGIDPTQGMVGVRELERAVNDLGFIGAHFYPHWFELPPDHARVYPFYAKCVELDVPIQMQVGQSHLYLPDVPLRSVGRPNVFIGADAHSPKYWPPQFVHYLNSYGQDKVIFGTDFPVLDFERTRQEIDALGLKPQVLEKLLRNNVSRVYGLA